MLFIFLNRKEEEAADFYFKLCEVLEKSIASEASLGLT